MPEGKEEAPNRGKLWKRQLQEGLSRPIDQQSKGYELLAKMGYKPGMTLGKKREDGECLFLFCDIYPLNAIAFR